MLPWLFLLACECPRRLIIAARSDVIVVHRQVQEIIASGCELFCLRRSTATRRAGCVAIGFLLAQFRWLAWFINHPSLPFLDFQLSRAFTRALTSLSCGGVASYSGSCRCATRESASFFFILLLCVSVFVCCVCCVLCLLRCRQMGCAAGKPQNDAVVKGNSNKTTKNGSPRGVGPHAQEGYVDEHGDALSDISSDRGESSVVHTSHSLEKSLKEGAAKADEPVTPDNDAGVFVWGDTTVPTNPKSIRPKAPVKPKTTVDKNTNVISFQWGDFKVSAVDELQEFAQAAPRKRTGSLGLALTASAQAPNSTESLLLSRSSVSSVPRPILRPKPDHKQIVKWRVRSMLGHSSRVKCIAIAPGEQDYVSCSNEDTTIALYDVKSGRERGLFSGHQDTIINAAFSYDTKFLATTSRDHTMILWDVVTSKPVLTFEHQKVVICCCFSRDSRFIATGCQDKVCRVWEARRGKEVLIFAQHEGIVISMCYSLDSTHIASASADKTVRVWSATTGRCKFTLTGHLGIVLSCSYSHDGKTIISNDEKLLRTWNAMTGEPLLSFHVESLFASPSAGLTSKRMTWTLSAAAPGEFTKYIVAACNNRFVYVLDADTGAEVLSFFCKSSVYCLAVGFTNYVAFGDSFGNVSLLSFE